jgi:hypothetical protein
MEISTTKKWLEAKMAQDAGSFQKSAPKNPQPPYQILGYLHFRLVGFHHS